MVQLTKQWKESGGALVSGVPDSQSGASDALGML